jgi:hypothetical protein
VQGLIGGDEGLVFFLAGANESYVFALTREGFEWRTIALGEKDMAAKIAAFRRGLDVDDLTESVTKGKPSCFFRSPRHHHQKKSAGGRAEASRRGSRAHRLYDLSS